MVEPTREYKMYLLAYLMELLGLRHHDNYKGDDALGEVLGALCNTLDRLKNKIDTSRKRVI